MNDEKRQRRFQFSLRKLMLWMAVWGIYLAFFGRWAGTPLAAGIAAYLTMIAVIRLQWGLKPGWLIVEVVTGCGLGLFLSLRNPRPDWLFLGLPLAVWSFAVGFFAGFSMGFVAFLFVHVMTFVVDLVDLWIQVKTRSR